MEKVIELNIQNSQDRERMILALANSGYTVTVVKRKDPNLIIGDDYFVRFTIKDSEIIKSTEYA